MNKGTSKTEKKRASRELVLPGKCDKPLVLRF